MGIPPREKGGYLFESLDINPFLRVVNTKSNRLLHKFK